MAIENWPNLSCIKIGDFPPPWAVLVEFLSSISTNAQLALLGVECVGS